MEEKNLSSLVFGNVVLESQFLGTTPRIYAADMRSYSLRPSPYATLSAPLNDLRRQLQPDHAEAIAKKIFDSVAEELNEKMPAWIDCHVKALEFFGKLPAIIVFDNAATATGNVSTEKARHIQDGHRPLRGVCGLLREHRYQQTASDKPNSKNGLNKG